MTPDDTSRLLIGLAGADLIVTPIIVLAAWRLREPALIERAVASVVLTIIASGAAVLGLARLHVVTVSNDAAILILSAGLLLVSLPQLVWAVLLVAGRFR